MRAAASIGLCYSHSARRSLVRGVLALLACGLLGAQPSVTGGLPGLAATCKDSRHAIQMVTPSPRFLLEASESIHPSLEPAFDCEWRGSIEILQGGSYQIDRDGTRVWIGGEEIEDTPRQLEAGGHELRIQYHREPGRAKVRPQWKSEFFAWEPLPSARLMHAASEEPSSEQTLIATGRRLVEEYGCINCHSSISAEIPSRRAPLLTGIGSRVQPAWTHAWLEAPRAHRRNARMPRMLNASQRRDVSAYLSSLRGAARSNAANASPQDVDEGRKLIEALGCSACHGDQGVSLDGLGSKFEQGALVDYLIEPAKFEPSGRMPSMLLNEQEAIQLAAYLMQSKDSSAAPSPPTGDAERGKRLVQTSGCLSCHELEDAAPLTSEFDASAWNDLRVGRGCLSESSTDTPRYDFPQREREAIEAFLTDNRTHPDVSEAPVFEFQRDIERLQCGSCHAIGQARPAGLSEAPPPLTDAGSKLRMSWLEGVLTGYNRVLGWFDLRMPHYEPEQVRQLIAGFAKASGVEPDRELVTATEDETLYKHGRDLLGTNPAQGGKACIGCHDWGENKALGEHGPQLINAAQRLREDWFRRWMKDPARILSGTSMPNYFISTPPQQADETLTALWAAFVKGADQPAPEGFEQNADNDPEAHPIPTDRPIVVRWDMPEATPAAIAVGLPGEVSYCFDAGESRLRYVWHGGFVDLSKTLLSKRDPETRLSYTADLVGEIFYRSGEFPIRVGRLEEIPQRRFRGYRLIDGYPEFHYVAGGIDVYEKIFKADGAVGLIREFRFDVVDQPVWLLPSSSDGVEISSSVAGAGPGPITVPRGRNVAVRLTILRRE